MQPTYGRLESKDPQRPKPIYVLIKSPDEISIHLKPPPFHRYNEGGVIGENCQIIRKKRGLLFSTFLLKYADEETVYFTDNKFGDLLNLFVNKTGTD
jgi:hypothetical protein